MNVTDRDREKAAWALLIALDPTLTNTASREAIADAQVETVAAALAEEREKARAPFLALAKTFSEKAELARNGQNQWGKDTFEHGEAYAFRQAAGDVLEAAEVTE